MFVIKESCQIVALYANLEKAKTELKNIYNTIFDFNHYSYEIAVYELIDDQYVMTNTIYIYKYDNFELKSERLSSTRLDSPKYTGGLTTLSRLRKP